MYDSMEWRGGLAVRRVHVTIKDLHCLFFCLNTSHTKYLYRAYLAQHSGLQSLLKELCY